MSSRRLRRTGTASLAGALALAASGAVAAADEPLERRWKKMSFADIDVTPFRWTSDDTCTYPSYYNLPPGVGRCDFYDLGVVDERNPSDSKTHRISLNWWERQPLDLELPCGDREGVTPGTTTAYIVRSRTRAASASVGSIYLGPSLTSRTESEHARRTAEYAARLAPDRAIWLRILSDIVARIEPYAIPCDPDAAPPPEPQPSGGTGGPGGQPVDLSGYMPADPPGPDWVPELLGQDPYEMRQPGGAGGNTAPETATRPTTPPPAGAGGSAAPRAMRRTAGSLPPEVVAAPLRFFAGGYDLVPRDRRDYAFRFDERVEYVHFEVPLVYPERRERLAFAVEVTTFRNGERYNSFVFESFTLEPGRSYSFPSVSLGRDGGGGWTPGRYRVEMTVDGAYLSSGEFEIVPAGR